MADILKMGAATGLVMKERMGKKFVCVGSEKK